MAAPSETEAALPASRPALLLRIVPLHLYSRRAGVVMERSVRGARSARWTIVSGFFEPVFYLLAMGVGIGSLVGAIETSTGPIEYAAYIAPALMATSAMNGAVFDATNNVFFKLKYAKLYDGMLATSLGPLDVAIGEVLYSLSRGAIYATTFQLVMLVMGLLHSWWALLAVPAAILIALGFAAVGMAVTTFLKTFQHLEWVTTALLPMFLFSTTFFPLSVYPRAIQILVECLPLYHGIELIRGLSLGQVGPALLGHASYFVAMAVVGILVAARRLERLLLT
ncbi:ABC transporter permease [Nakamurella sp. A5-74]|uniref:Transport permease protein n=1 Tax=Nakamurella sp. A5-74 TaxID=3158264 RepID=A0AAU8DUQ3_9ACTN